MITGNREFIAEGNIIENRRLAGNHYLLVMIAPVVSHTPMPGQFIMVKFAGRRDPLLCRPFSVYGFERKKNEAKIEILYRVVGRGTTIMSGLKQGDDIHIFGFYGRAFDIFQNKKNIVFIAGGVGVAPITYLAKCYHEKVSAFNMKLICYQGAGTKTALIGLERLRAHCSLVITSTDDGSEGFDGQVTELFARDLSLYAPEETVVYACGPKPMLKRIWDILKDTEIPCQVLLEERMACGLGACLGCVVPIKSNQGQFSYARVCKEGPVFSIGDIAWDKLYLELNQLIK